jgi:hypothetical protein
MLNEMLMKESDTITVMLDAFDVNELVTIAHTVLRNISVFTAYQ